MLRRPSLVAPEVAQATRRILIVDDNQDSALSLVALLEIAGHATRTAQHGAHAMVQAEHYSPDVVLLDIGIPGMSGYEVCRRLRQQPWGRATMIATMTDWGQKEDRRRAEAAGFDQHLLKPVDHAALTQVLVSAPSTLETPAASNTVRPQC